MCYLFRYEILRSLQFEIKNEKERRIFHGLIHLDTKYFNFNIKLPFFLPSVKKH